MKSCILSFFIFLLYSYAGHTTSIIFPVTINQNDTLKKETPEELVQRQLDAYNARDIDGFMATYSEDIILNTFPETIIVQGQPAMRIIYKTMFQDTPNLFCEIKKRIVIGNKVIDHEYVRKNESFINAVAIYEVTNGLISKVTFIK